MDNGHTIYVIKIPQNSKDCNKNAIVLREVMIKYQNM